MDSTLPIPDDVIMLFEQKHSMQGAAKYVNDALTIFWCHL